MKEVLVIINPASGGFDKTKLVMAILNYCSMEGFLPTIYQTTGRSDAELIQQIIEKKRPEIIVVAAGDGVVNLVSGLVKDKGLPLALVPAGSANGLATELHIPRNPWMALEYIKSKPPKPVDLIKVDNDYHIVHMADLGFNAKMIKRYQFEEQRGFIGYAMSAIKELPRMMEPIEVTIETPDFKKHFTTNYVAIANAKKYGTGITINSKGNICDGFFEICVLKEYSLMEFARMLWEGESYQNEIFEVIKARKSILTCTNKSDFQIDGEYLGLWDRISFEMAGSAFKVFY